MNQKIAQGIFFAFITAIISGFSLFYNKLILIKGLDPLIFNILKNGGVAAVLSVMLLTSIKKRAIIRTTLLREWRWVLLIGLLGGSIPFFLFFEGLALASAAHATIIHKTLFIWVALIALPVLHERLSFVQIIGYLLIVYSNFLLGGFSGFQMGRGEVMILIATLLWSVETIVAKRIISRTGSLFLAWGRMFFGTIFLLIFAGAQGKFSLFTHITSAHIMPLAGSILFLTGYVVSWYWALRLAPAVIVTSVLVLSTPITTLLTGVFITRTLSNPQLASTILIAAGVSLIVYALNSVAQSVVRK